MSGDRARIVADLRFLATTRAEYCHRCPESQSDMAEMSQADLALHTEHSTAAWLADIIDGQNSGSGWLPSWRWDEWAERGSES